MKEQYLIERDGYNNMYTGCIMPACVELHEIGEYDESSVLAGQMYDRVIEDYDTMTEAQIANPDVEVHTSVSGIRATVPSLAPEGFDPADAGERWDDDY